MLIPKCCKNCSGRGNGVCNCTLPIYCQEYVEDDETYPTNVGGTINTPNTSPFIILDRPVEFSEPASEWKKVEYVSSRKAGKSFEMRDKLLKEKDHRIAVLEKALKNCCEHLVNTTDIITKPFSEDYADESRIKEKFQIYIDQAEKELEGENDKN